MGYKQEKHWVIIIESKVIATFLNRHFTERKDADCYSFILVGALEKSVDC